MTADSDQSPGEAEPDPSWSGLRGLARAGNLEYDRVLFFSDAIFAIAITLLVLDIHVPSSANASAGKALSAGVPRITSFVISFLVIGMFWMGHHRIFRLITGLDRPLIALNLLFLGTIAFMPYPTALLRIGNSLERPAVIFYALCISLAGATEYAIWAYATRHKGLAAATVTVPVRRYLSLRILRIPAVFLASVPVAFLSPTLASYMWILIAVAGIAIERFAQPPAPDHPASAATA